MISEFFGYILKKKIKVSIFICVIFIFFMTSCVPLKHINPSVELKPKVLKYWEAKIKNDYVKMYALEADVNRKNHDFSGYVKIFGSKSKIVQYSIEDIQINEKMTQAVVKVSYQIELMIPIPGLLGYKRALTCDDTWVFEKKDWYHLK